jgi:acylphosphatase
VQGVGFRYTAHSIARGFAVTGFVKNLRDGRVQIVVEGESAEVRAFLESIQTELGHYISDVVETASPSQGGFSGFEIRF